MRLTIVLLIGAFALAQTAEVHDLTADESAEGQKLYAEMQRADKAYADYQRRMETKYLPSPGCGWADTQGNHGSCGKPGEFSAGFHHILPKPQPLPGNTFYWNNSPAVGLTGPLTGINPVADIPAIQNNSCVAVGSDGKLTNAACNIVLSGN
jgi:hypothetical protein